MIRDKDKCGLLKEYDIQTHISKKIEEKNKYSSKNDRDLFLMKKRKERNPDQILDENEKNAIEEEIRARISAVRLDFFSKSEEVKLNAAIEIRKLLSIENNPPINEVIEAGIIPYISELLSLQNDPRLQFEAAWIITNVASGDSEQTEKVVNQGVVPRLIKLLGGENEEVKEQSVWALGNISGDSVKFRDFVLNNGALEVITESIINGKKISFIRNAVWTLSNLCRFKPGPNSEQFSTVLKILSKLIYSEDLEIVADTCWTLSYLSDGSYERTQEIIECGIVKRICELLTHNNQTIQVPSLRTVGNIVTGDDFQTQVVINCSALPCLLDLIKYGKRTIKREACWTISNITAGNTDQIQSVIDQNIFPILNEIIMSSDLDIKKEAAWAISNATSGGSPDQVKYIADQGCIPGLIDLLNCPDDRVVKVLIEALDNILEMGEKKKEDFEANPYCSEIEYNNGLDMLESLQHHSNEEIYLSVKKILEKFFGAEEESSELVNNLDKVRVAKEQNLQIPSCQFNL